MRNYQLKRTIHIPSMPMHLPIAVGEAGFFIILQKKYYTYGNLQCVGKKIMLSLYCWGNWIGWISVLKIM